LPDMRNKSEDLISSTSCVQYDANMKVKNSACSSWYDYTNMFVLCECEGDGLTVNIFDKVESNMKILGQFPSVSLSLCKLIFLCFSKSLQCCNFLYSYRIDGICYACRMYLRQLKREE